MCACPFCDEDPRAHHGRITHSLPNGFFYAITNLKPLLPGHILICSREHANGLSEALSQHPLAAAEFSTFVGTVSQALMRAFQTDSYNLMIQEGPHSGQSIQHLHLHLIPRMRDDIKGEWFKLFMSEEHGEHSAPEWSVEERTVEAQRLREYFPPEYVDMEDREEECENVQQLVESDVQE